MSGRGEECVENVFLLFVSEFFCAFEWWTERFTENMIMYNNIDWPLLLRPMAIIIVNLSDVAHVTFPEGKVILFAYKFAH